jgi:hypothetical protein
MRHPDSIAEGSPWRTYWAGVASVKVKVGPDAIVVALKRQP